MRKSILCAFLLAAAAWSACAQDPIPFRKGNAMGYCNFKKEIVIPLEYEDAGSFGDGLAPVYLAIMWFYIDKKGKTILGGYPIPYTDANSFSEGPAAVWIKTQYGYQYGYIDRTGKMVIPERYGKAMPFSEGLAAVKACENPEMQPTERCVSAYGFIDKTGRQVIPFKYADAAAFEGGLALVKSGERWGYIDKTGTEYWED